MKVEQNPKIRLSLVRVLGNLAKKCGKRAKQIVADAGVPFFLNALNTKVRLYIKLNLCIFTAKLKRVHDLMTQTFRDLVGNQYLTESSKIASE
jgi:hypothetical protein